MLVTALVRSGAQVGISHLRKLFWARPLTPAERRARRARRSRSTTRTRSCSTRGQGGRRLLHDVLRQPVLEVHRALVRPARPHAEPGHDGLGAHRRRSPRRRSPPASGGAWSPARSCSSSRSRPTASTASSPATRGSSRSSARGWTPSSTARRSTSSSPAWRSATRRRTATTCGSLAGAALTLQTVRHTIDFSFGAARQEVIGATRAAAARAAERPARGRRRRASRARARAVAPADAGRRRRRGRRRRARVPLHRRVLGLWRRLDRCPA